ncbi:MAG TPA: glucose-6-phosphate dehydrogenase [Candidatus Eremiobacteraceae bacterium]|nr:glucose-6-phosphate dehydrogenase [Candidatus Eremiobacteraceae bacterium]
MATAELVNPFREGLNLAGATEPVQLVIFGASGDLTKRKLLPAIYNLVQAGLAPQAFAVVGFARAPMSGEDFRGVLKAAVAESSEIRERDDDVLKKLSEHVDYVSGDFHNPAAYTNLKAQLDELDKRFGTSGNRIFYIATPASLYGDIAAQLHACGLTTPAEAGSFVRMIVEKPFGRDLASAKKLNAELLTYLREDQIYRIDHYLGKETVQNILVLRFANAIFEPIWNRRYIDSIQITVAESLGIEGRGNFYEETGVVRDVIQNHALQLMSLVAMEPPTTFDARDFRDEKIRVVEAIHPIESSEVDKYAVRGQYGPGSVAGERVVGYRQEPNVAPDSITPTYAAFRLQVDNWRWAGVRFYIRSGKRLPKRVTEIAMQFKEAPHLPFRKAQVETPEGDVLSLQIQPDEGIVLRFAAKVPGPSMRIRSVEMDFGYGETFGSVDASPYERLILDCMKGDQTLFDRADGVEAAWALVDPVLRAWESQRSVAFPNYDAGTWGPAAADALLERDGRKWRQL